MTKIFSKKLSAIKYHTPFVQKMDNASLPQHAAVLVSNAKVSSLSLRGTLRDVKKTAVWVTRVTITIG